MIGGWKRPGLPGFYYSPPPEMMMKSANCAAARCLPAVRGRNLNREEGRL